ncbi:hypothetical protein L5G28_01870 [Gordonia sp. HY285]|uniref:hypothetical protein n=1 Tax=Gordonia liuliyuniae TaxID=2911517 RepID=UPI001F1CF2B1|nr:hypothetical protein [Gordonia liuliyuniae]MCF8608913.1 hypothetical protein [Gordonia liuliyuniae]
MASVASCGVGDTGVIAAGPPGLSLPDSSFVVYFGDARGDGVVPTSVDGDGLDVSRGVDILLRRSPSDSDVPARLINEVPHGSAQWSKDALTVRVAPQDYPLSARANEQIRCTAIYDGALNVAITDGSRTVEQSLSSATSERGDSLRARAKISGCPQSEES